MSQQSALELAVGPLLVLICVACILFGVFSTQIFYYANNYEKDGPKLKMFVFCIWLLETLHTAFCIHVIYNYFVIHYGDPIHGINVIVWSAPVTVLLELMIVTMTEGFYIRRIWHLCGKKLYIVALPALLLVLRAAFSLLTFAFLYKYTAWAEYREHNLAQASLKAGFALGLVADFTITAMLIWYLRSRRTKFVQTNMKLQKLMYYTINTGALTLIVSAAIIGTISIENSLMFGGLVEVVSKLYANSMLAMLNARKYIHQVGESDMSEFNNAIELSGAARTDNHIKIVTETQVARDQHFVSVYKDSGAGSPLTDVEYHAHYLQESRGLEHSHDSFNGFIPFETAKVRTDALTEV
ncbi:hypothetical protein BDW22DRAFT_1342899 [Trametopsis cervina]|nr:hypothetical protein BDW22DRAFT_1342899 [Trametopsis cervina]